MMLKIRNLQKNFDDLEVLKDINIDVDEGEVVCIIGPSGSGKSTLLRCINQLEIPTAGEISSIKGKSVTGGEIKAERLPRGSRHGLPAVQPVPYEDGPGKCHAGSGPDKT